MIPTANRIEVEVKTLLGQRANVEEFVAKLKQSGEDFAMTGRSSQLNHYFDDQGDPEQLPDAVANFIDAADLQSLRDLLGKAKKFSLRTRDADGDILLVIKAAKSGEDDQHAISRLEGEYRTTAPDIDTLDAAIKKAGYDFLSKWSRQRTEYRYKDYTVCIDRNAGYGYLAEIEKLVATEAEAKRTRQAILSELKMLGAEELSQERIGRMFDYYNAHWSEYYRTSKTFTIE